MKLDESTIQYTSVVFIGVVIHSSHQRNHLVINIENMDNEVHCMWTEFSKTVLLDWLMLKQNIVSCSIISDSVPLKAEFSMKKQNNSGDKVLVPAQFVSFSWESFHTFFGFNVLLISLVHHVHMHFTSTIEAM